MPLNIEQRLEQMAQTISESRWHFTVWDTLQEARRDESGARVMNKYLDFFRPTVLAHFESYIIACYQIYETRPDTLNFRTLEDAITLEGSGNIFLAERIIDIKVEMKAIWIKISRVRNQAVGHMTAETQQQIVFNNAGLEANEILQFIALAEELFNLISSEWNDTIEAFNLNGRNDTNRLINDLKSIV